MQRILFAIAIVLSAGWTLSAQVVNSGGVVTPNATAGPTTPSITLGTTSPSPAGASNATPGNQAGATNSTLQPTAPTGIAPQTVYTSPVIQSLPQNAASNTTAANQLSPIGRNLPPALYDSAWSVAVIDAGNVAEAARKARMAKASHRPRVYTNADIARLHGQAPVNGAGDVNASNRNAPVANEQTMPASDVGAENAPTTPVAPKAPPAQSEQQPKSPFGTTPLPQPR